MLNFTDYLATYSQVGAVILLWVWLVGTMPLPPLFSPSLCSWTWTRYRMRWLCRGWTWHITCTCLSLLWSGSCSVWHTRPQRLVISPDTTHLLHNVVRSPSFLKRVLEEVLQMVKPTTNSALVLNAIMTSFKPDFISSRALSFAELIKDADETALPKVSIRICVDARTDETILSLLPAQAIRVSRQLCGHVRPSGKRQAPTPEQREFSTIQSWQRLVPVSCFLFLF